MGNWWIDEEPWPGPKERPPFDLSEFRDAFRTISLSFGRGFGKLAASFEAMGASMHDSLAEELKAYKPTSHAGPPRTREELLERKKNLQHGPYAGGFDRRGRKF